MTDHLKLAKDLEAAARILRNRIEANPSIPRGQPLFESKALCIDETISLVEYLEVSPEWRSSYDLVRTPLAQELSWFCRQARDTIIRPSYGGKWLYHQFGLFTYYYKGPNEEFLPALYNFAVALAGDSSGELQLMRPGA